MKKFLTIAAALLLGLGAMTSCKKDGPINNAAKLVGTWEPVSAEVFKGDQKVEVSAEEALKTIGSRAKLTFNSDGSGVENISLGGRTVEAKFTYTLSSGKLSIKETVGDVISVSSTTVYSASLSGDNLVLTIDESDPGFKAIVEVADHAFDKVVSTYKKSK